MAAEVQEYPSSMWSPALLAVFLIGGLVSNCAAQLTPEPVSTTTGTVQGLELATTTGRVRAFLGIPYAEPPTGALRFQKPIPKQEWEGVLNATSLPPLCAQNPSRLNQFLDIKATDKMSEDCLYLNVFAPVTNVSPKPVVVYIHGGGFTSGGISLEVHDSSELTVRGDLVTVVIGYRLGAFGFLRLGIEDVPGNMGLYDQVLALRWVKDNIRSFGGDPNNVTLMGPSAGSFAVSVHILSPLSGGLFHRAVMQGASPFSRGLRITKDEATLRSRKLATELGCETADTPLRANQKEVAECLRSKDAASILAADKNIAGVPVDNFLPVFGDEMAPEEPEVALRNGHFNAVDLLTGITEAEGDFLLYYIFNPIFNLSRAEGVQKRYVIFLLKMALAASGDLDANAVLDHYFNGLEESDSVKALHAGADILGHLQIVCPTLEFSRRFASQNNSVYFYRFSHRPSFSEFPDWVRTTHTDDTPFSLGSMFKLVKDPTDADVEAAQNLIQAISSFSYKGTPRVTGQEPWPKYDDEGRYGDFGPKSFTLKKGLMKSECDFWNNILPVDSSS